MILIALQGMHAIEYDDSAARDQLDELAVAIDKAPSSWNWCIRRKRLHRQFLWGTFPKAPGEYISSGSMHKLMTPGSHQGRLFSMTLPNVEIAPDKAIACGFYDGGSSLAAMLKVSRVLISHSSSTACAAAMLGVPAIFWDERGAGLFPDLIASGAASYVPIARLEAAIAPLL